MAVGLADSRELPLTIIGAVLGVAMTVFATFILLNGQAELTQEGENQSEIFKQKLQAYQRFLDALCQYVETREDKAKAKLQFHTAALAMHCTEEQVVKTNIKVGEIISMYQGPDANDMQLLHALFDISDYLRTSLYPDMAYENAPEYEESIRKLTNTFENSNDSASSEEMAQDDTALNNEIDRENGEAGGWEATEERFKKMGWIVDVDTATDRITFTRAQSKGTIIFRKPKKGTFYIVEVATADNDCEFTKQLKAIHKGSRNAGIWWRELTSLPNYGIRSGQLAAAIAENAKACAVVTKWAERLTDFISNSK